MNGVEFFYGSVASTAGGFAKMFQNSVIKIPSLEEMQEQVNAFISKPEIEVVNIHHQFTDDGVISVLVHYRKK